MGRRSGQKKAGADRRFCVQCGERNCEHDLEDKSRCHDCAGTPVEARFCPITGKRLNPPPLPKKSPFDSYAGRVEVGVGFDFGSGD